MDKLLPIGAVLDAVGVSRSSLYQWVGEGRFPRPVQVGPRAVRWRSSEVESWIASRPPAA